MILLTKEILEKIPKIGETENEADPMVWVKLFYPDFSWTWYIIEYDGQDECFGYVDGFERELGYFTISELQANRGQLGLPIERDRFFEPCRLSGLQRKLKVAR